MASWYSIPLIQMSAFFSVSYSKISPWFIAEKQSGIGDCLSFRGHRKTTIVASIVYGLNNIAVRQPQLVNMYQCNCPYPVARSDDP